MAHYPVTKFQKDDRKKEGKYHQRSKTSVPLNSSKYIPRLTGHKAGPALRMNRPGPRPVSLKCKTPRTKGRFQNSPEKTGHTREESDGIPQEAGEW